MSKKLYLSFLWHMHQPCYKNAITEEYEMPWIFLHGIKDYYEMPWYVSKFQKIKATFNLVPSLLVQLQDYVKGTANCKFLKTINKPVEKLTKDERIFLLEMLFFANVKTMIFPFKRYYELFNRKNRLKEENAEDDVLVHSFSNQDILDLEVLFLLSWTGNSFREKSQIIQKLIKKELNYTEEDKSELLKELFNLIKEIIPFYKELETKNQISISTTPFYHPIIPLLIDINSAKEATPDVHLPKIYTSFKDDAAIQVSNAKKYYENLFGKEPKGFWPSEGSISNETLKLFSDKGIFWTASDEDVLFNSIGIRHDGHEIYKRYKFVKDGKQINIIFRDKKLSDLIGFTYSSWNPEEAAEDFVNRLKAIYNWISFNPVVPVILDGENAWEFYYKNGKEFFENLYSLIEKQDWIETITIDEIFEREDIKEEIITNIVAGSWIGGNFLTWVGHEEKNKGWEYLSQTKQFVNSKKIENSEIRSKVHQLLLIAEGSDWFWWYGDDHYSDFADKFDILFRSNLIKIYDLLGEKPPDEFYKPIKKSYKSPFIRLPNYYVRPILDGEITSYFEWLNGGIVDLQFDASTMDTSGSHLQKLHYGFDKENLYLMIEGNIENILNQDYYLGIDIILPSKKIHLKILLSNQSKKYETKDFECNGIDFAIDRVIEIKIPKECLENASDIEIAFKIFKNDKTVEKAPFYNFVPLEINKNFDYEWYI